MMRVLLISPNVEVLPDPIFPLGLAYIAAALKRRGIDHRVLDLCFVTDVEDALSAEIASYRPDLTGLSLRNLDNVSYPQYTSYLPFYREVIDIIRRHSDSRIVLGGSAFSLMPDEIFACLDVDFGIVGEGELAIIELLERIEAMQKTGGHLEKCIIRDQDVGVIQKLDDFPAPDRSGLDNAAYLEFGGICLLYTSDAADECVNV